MEIIFQPHPSSLSQPQPNMGLEINWNQIQQIERPNMMWTSLYTPHQFLETPSLVKNMVQKMFGPDFTTVYATTQLRSPTTLLPPI